MSRLFGQFIFHSAFNQNHYLNMLQIWLVHFLEAHGIKETCWFQHNGEPANYPALPGRWIGHGSPGHKKAHNIPQGS